MTKKEISDITGCPDPQLDLTWKRWLCGCTELYPIVNHGDPDGWLFKRGDDPGAPELGK